MGSISKYEANDIYLARLTSQSPNSTTNLVMGGYPKALWGGGLTLTLKIESIIKQQISRSQIWKSIDLPQP